MSVRPRPQSGLVQICSACLRCAPEALMRRWHPSPTTLFQQVRGKKTSRQPATIVVRLLQNVNAYGKKGALVPVSIGQMRNIWYPGKVAEYVPALQLRDLSRSGMSMVRDYQFGARPSKAGSEPLPKIESIPEWETIPGPKIKEVKLLSPERATQLIEIFVPPRLDFYRTPIETQPTAPTTPPPQKPSSRTKKEASAELFEADASGLNPAIHTKPVKSEPERIPIFGSVSTVEIANHIKALLAENDEAALVVLTAEDIQFVGLNESDENDRVKFIGDYEVEIFVKGSEEAVKRTVRVLATTSE